MIYEKQEKTISSIMNDGIRKRKFNDNEPNDSTTNQYKKSSSDLTTVILSKCTNVSITQNCPNH